MTRFKVVYSPSAQRAIASLPLKVVDAVLAFCEGPLAENPQRVGKELKFEKVGFYSARRGSYRIIYMIHDVEVVVMAAKLEHRAHVYRG